MPFAGRLKPGACALLPVAFPGQSLLAVLRRRDDAMGSLALVNLTGGDCGVSALFVGPYDLQSCNMTLVSNLYDVTLSQTL